MTLLERIQANQCAVDGCHEDRISDGPCCADHMRDLWANRLDRTDTGYVVRRALRPRDETWVGRAA
jgi:hypothetical protein